MVDDIISISPPYNGGEKGGNNVESNQNQGHQGGLQNNNVHLNQTQLQLAQQQVQLQQAQQHQQQMSIQNKGYNYQQQQQPQPQSHLMNQLINNNGFQQQIH